MHINDLTTRVLVYAPEWKADSTGARKITGYTFKHVMWVALRPLNAMEQLWAGGRYPTASHVAYTWRRPNYQELELCRLQTTEKTFVVLGLQERSDTEVMIWLSEIRGELL